MNGPGAAAKPAPLMAGQGGERGDRLVHPQVDVTTRRVQRTSGGRFRRSPSDGGRSSAGLVQPIGVGDCQKCHHGEFSRPFAWEEFWPHVKHGKEIGPESAVLKRAP